MRQVLWNRALSGVVCRNPAPLRTEASSLLGYSKVEAMGKNLVSGFITQEFRQSVNQVLSSALLGKETANFEFPLFTKSGERKERQRAHGHAAPPVSIVWRSLGCCC